MSEFASQSTDKREIVMTAANEARFYLRWKSVVAEMSHLILQMVNLMERARPQQQQQQQQQQQALQQHWQLLCLVYHLKQIQGLCWIHWQAPHWFREPSLALQQLPSQGLPLQEKEWLQEGFQMWRLLHPGLDLQLECRQEFEEVLPQVVQCLACSQPLLYLLQRLLLEVAGVIRLWHQLVG